eukprot:2540227-Rhodomonas_salina.1
MCNRFLPFVVPPVRAKSNAIPRAGCTVAPPGTTDANEDSQFPSSNLPPVVLPWSPSCAEHAVSQPAAWLRGAQTREQQCAEELVSGSDRKRESLPHVRARLRKSLILPRPSAAHLVSRFSEIAP